MPKRSTTSLPNDWRPTLFFDATTSAPDLAEVLRAANWSVELHKAHFPTRGDIPDHEWVPYAAGKGWAIITCDKRMQYWGTEGGKVRPVIEQFAAKVFFIKGGCQLSDYAHAIGLAKESICRAFRQHRRTFLYARLHTKGPRVGEVEPLVQIEGSRTQKKYGEDKRA